MTLEKLSNWWETPGLGELSLAAGSVPLGLGTYVAGTRLLNASPRTAAAAGVAAGTAQAVNNMLQARTNGRAGLVTPSDALTDVGKSILTGGMGVLGGVGLSSIANLGAPTKKTIATLGALMSAADYARRRGRAALERRAYGNELDRQMEDYYSKEAEVTWYGHEKLSGSLLGRHVDVSPSTWVLPRAVLPIDFLLQKFAASPAPTGARSVPAPPRAQNRPNIKLRAAAERSARNAVASGSPANAAQPPRNVRGNAAPPRSAAGSSIPASNNRSTAPRPQSAARVPYSGKPPEVQAASAAGKPNAFVAPRIPRPAAPAPRPAAPANVRDVSFTGEQAAAAMAPNLTDRMFGAQRLGRNQVARAAPAQNMSFTEDEAIANFSGNLGRNQVARAAARPAAPANVRDVSFTGEESAAAMAPNLTDSMFGSQRLGQNQVARATNRVRGFF